MRTKQKVLVLLSGGIDSVVTLYLARKKGFKPQALIFDYNQRHDKEVKFAVRNAKKIKVPYQVIRIKFPWAGSALTDKKIKIPRRLNKSRIPVTYVPARNLIFLSFAVSFAESTGIKKIFIGAHTQDYSGYPDCRPDFLNSFQATANFGTKAKNIEIVAPFLASKKSDIIKTGSCLGVDFKYTWSCYQGAAKPCRVCDSCRYRQKGFSAAGLSDPLEKNKI
jgi:7-cyano-7-deazaguanine synthase